MKKKKTPVFRAIAIRVCALVFACWFCLSGLLTWAVAAEMRRGIENSVFRQVHAITDFRGGHTAEVNTDGLPGAMEVNTISYLPYLYYHLGNLDSRLPVVMDTMPSSYGKDVWYNGKNDLLYGFEPAAVFMMRQEKYLLAVGILSPLPIPQRKTGKQGKQPPSAWDISTYPLLVIYRN